MLTTFTIHGFRGVEKDNISIEKYQAIIGGNGSGKTHILEAIHLLSGGSLHYFQAPRSEDTTFSGIYRESIGEKLYSLSRQDTRDIYAIQGVKVTAKKYRETLPYRSVFISPFDMNLLYFTPSIRRDYIDSILDRAFYQFRLIKREYEGIMRQRNALLKKIREGEAQRSDLDFWDRNFAEKTYVYGLYRKKWFHFIGENGIELVKFLEKYSIECVYESKYIHEEMGIDFITNYLKENRERDILTGHTHIGPHLDDFSFQISILGSGLQNQKHDSSLYLSRGETKMLLLGLKQLEILFLKKYLHIPIILLLDDLFAELDMNHAEKLIEKFDVDQIILTTQRDLPKNEKWDHFSCINLSPV